MHLACIAMSVIAFAHARVQATTLDETQIAAFFADSLITISVEHSNYTSLAPLFNLVSSDTLIDIPTAENETRASQIRQYCGLRTAQVSLVSYTNRNDSLLLTLSCPISLVNRVTDALRVLESKDIVSIMPLEPTHPLLSPSPSSTRKLLLIYDHAWEAATKRYAAYRRSTGWETEIRDIDEILVRQTGRDNAEKLRNELIGFSQGGGSAVLLLGDERTIPVRYLSQFSRSIVPSITELFPGDLYFADCNGDWNADNDSLWGEPYVDLADLTPELLVGRLPISNESQLDHYLKNMIRYEFPPEQDDLHYRQSVLFFSSDQMRDEQQGQHNQIAKGLPATLLADSIVAVETPYGGDISPNNTPASELSNQLEQGAGIVSVLAHGDYRGFVVRSSGINNFPKSKALSSPEGDQTGMLSSLLPGDRPSFWHSIACDNGGYDLEDKQSTTSFSSMVRHLLLDSGNAVGMIAYSRWGWVNTSWRQQKGFFDSARTHPDDAASIAMYRAQMTMRSQLDQVYGQNYYGDPTLVMSLDKPQSLACEITRAGSLIRVTVPERIAQQVIVFLSDEHGLIASQTIMAGSAHEFTNINATDEYVVTIQSKGFAGMRRILAPSIVTGIDDDEGNLPNGFRLDQNYPNPFNPNTTISFSIDRNGEVSLTIYNTLGQQIRRLVEQPLAAGDHEVIWNGRDDHQQEIASGLYYYRLETANNRQTRTLLLLK